MAAGLVFGLLAGLLISLTQTQVYQATSRLMFVQRGDKNSTGISYINNSSLAQTLSELIVSRPVIEEAENRLEYDISSRQILVQQVGNTDVLQLFVSDDDPIQAAEIANAVTEVFIEQQAEISAGLFASSEESLAHQIDQVQAQIDALQRDAVEEARFLMEAQVDELRTTLDNLRAEAATLQREIVELQFAGTPVPGYDTSGRWGYVLPTPSVEQRVEIEQKNNRLSELNRLVGLYESLYVDMTYNRAADRIADTVPDDVQITLDQYQVIYRNLLANYEAIRLARIQSTPNLTQIETALIPEQPVYPNPALFAGLGALVGLLGGLGLAFVLVYTDEVFRSADEARILLRLPVLAQVRDLQSDGHQPKELSLAGRKPVRKLDLLVRPNRSPQLQQTADDGLRFLRSNLDVLQDQQPIQTLLLAMPGDGTSGSLLAVRLAQTFAEGGRKVALLDADLRSGKVAEILKLPNNQGLSDVLAGEAQLKRVIHTLDGGCMTVVLGGSPSDSPADIMDRDKLAGILNTLQQQAELVIIHSPPFAFAEASILASRADAVILAVEVDRTLSTAALATMEQLHLSNANVIGMVIL